MGDHFISGYTGFCPEVADHVGCNYSKVTQEIMKCHPHLKTRLSRYRFSDREMGDACDGKEGVQFCCQEPTCEPTCAPTCAPMCAPVCEPVNEPVCNPEALDENEWSAYQGDSGPCMPNCNPPLQCYPLSCSEWGSPCISNHCNEVYTPCLRRRRFASHDHEKLNPVIVYPNCYEQMLEQKSEPCCDSCATGGPCSGDSNKAKSEISVFRRPSRICNSSSGMDYRRGGVVPNYMGHIPGLQNSFGEPYAMAASRLLLRHFDELAKRGV